MVVDSSVLVCILLAESEAEYYANLLVDADVFISAVSIVESAMVIEYKRGVQGAIEYDELLNILDPTIITFDREQANLARAAWRQYGKGRHPAKLNFGDCCSYAAAKHLNQPLLFKGDDFSKTDIKQL